MSAKFYKVVCKDPTFRDWKAIALTSAKVQYTLYELAWDFPCEGDVAAVMIFAAASDQVVPLYGVTWKKSQWGQFPQLFEPLDMKVGNFIRAHRAVFNLMMEEQQAADEAAAAAVSPDDTVTLTDAGRKAVQLAK